MSRAPTLMCCLAVSLAAASAHAAETPRAVVLRPAKVLDVRTGQLKELEVSVVGGRIVAVAKKVAVPAAAMVIELPGLTLMPGLIDAHTHLLAESTGALSEEQNIVVELAMHSPAERALMGAAHAKQMLYAGFTTVRELGNSGRTGDVDLKLAIERGWVEGPRIIASTRALGPPGGQVGRLSGAAKGLVAEEYAEVATPAEAARAVQEAINDGAQVIKLIVDSPPRLLDAATVQAVVDAAHVRQLKVAAHCQTEAGAKLAVAANVDSIEHGYELNDALLKEMVRRGIALVATDVTADEANRLFIAPRHLPPADEAALGPKVDAVIEQRRDRLRRAAKAGVRIVAGSDMYYAESGKTRGQLSLEVFDAYREAGLSGADIVRAATLNAAALLGLDDLGTVESGKRADLIAVPGDPTTDPKVLKAAAFVMRDGAVYLRP